MFTWSIREWFEVHWKLAGADERKKALSNWDDAEFQKTVNCERTKHLDISQTKFWLQNLMSELREISVLGKF